jgi:hypothetical protein
MTRVCIISDSHVQAMQEGWSLVQNGRPDCEVTFFAAAQENMKTLEVSAGRLISNDARCAHRMRRSSNGLEGIDGDYDQYLLAGLEFGFHPAIRLWRTFRIECESTDERTPVSDACFGCAIEDNLRETILVVTVEKLREITDRPITVLPYPMRCRPETPKIRGNREPGADRKVKELAENAARRLSQEYHFKLFLQPEHTFSDPLVTSTIYRQERRGNDWAHMNAAYGKEVLNMFLDRSPAGLL